MIPCPICGTEFEPRDPRQQCCSKACGVKRYNKTTERLAQGRAQYRKHHDERRDKANARYDQDPEFRAAAKAAARAIPENREHAARKTREWREAHPEWAARLDAERKTRGNKRKTDLPPA